MEELQSAWDALNLLLGTEQQPRELTALQVSARAVVIAIAGLAMLRLAHKRFFARRNAMDVLLTFVLASTLARAINGNAAFWPTIGGGFALIFMHRGLSWLAARFELIGGLLKGHSATLIDDGRVLEETLRQHSLSRKDLDEDLRIAGVRDATAVEHAKLERNGQISVQKR